MLQGSQKK